MHPATLIYEFTEYVPFIRYIHDKGGYLFHCIFKATFSNIQLHLPDLMLSMCPAPRSARRSGSETYGGEGWGWKRWSWGTRTLHLVTIGSTVKFYK